MPGVWEEKHRELPPYPDYVSKELRKMFKALVFALLTVSTMPVASFAQPAPQQSLKSALHLDSYTTLRYLDKGGATITEPEFMTLVSKGQSFSIDKNDVTSVATLSIDSKASAPPKKLKPGQSNTTLSIPLGKPVPHTLLAGLFTASGVGDELVDRPILLSFFFHDCLPCIQEVGTLNKFREHSKRVGVLAVTFESKQQAAKFSSRYGLEWPVAANSQKFIDELGVKVYPTLVLLSANGTLLGVRTGDLRSTSNVESPLVALQAWTQALLPPKHNE